MGKEASRKKRRKMMARNNKAFSLVEVIVALFVFSILMASISQVYVQFVDAQSRSSSLQKRTENLQLASNLVSKTARGSIIVSPTTPFEGMIQPAAQLRLFDLSRTTGNCLAFRFSGTALEMASSIAQVLDGNACGALPFPDAGDSYTTAFIPLTDTSYSVSGSFYYRNPVTSLSAGFVSVTLWACDGVGGCSASSANAVKVQSSVSMRI